MSTLPTESLDVATLRAALTALLARLALPADERVVEALLNYLALLQRWNATYNLTAVRDPAQMLTQHLADCLAIIAPLRRELGSHAGHRVLDVGSGGGLPGAIIAIMLQEVSVTCVDTVGKKAAFIQQLAGSLRLGNLQSRHARVEELDDGGFDVVTSRAFASLADFTRLTTESLAVDGVWLAMKGKMPSDEIAALPSIIEVFHVEQLAVPDLDADRCLIWMKRSRSGAAHHSL